ncbi:MAG TPA: hypothetical protein VFA21_18005 [Pyrinomonadaceae bacterium]|jgi:hypothetical protein|nr:hypothetical protein [Pyrinomonadaceae bacterium]
MNDKKTPSWLSVIVGLLSLPFLLRPKLKTAQTQSTLARKRLRRLSIQRPIAIPDTTVTPNTATGRSNKTAMWNPLSWSLDSWYFILQVSSAAILGLTIAVGYFINKRQSAKILVLDKDIADARTKQANAERALLELQRAVSPRRWVNQVASAQELKRFAGVTVIVEYFDRDDCPEITGLLTGTLSLAGWKVDGPHPSQDGYLTADGIEIQHSIGPTANDDVSTLAAVMLAEQLLNQDLDFQLRPSATQLPPNTIRIKISLRPVTHILSEEERGLREEQKTQQREQLEMLQKVEEQYLKSKEKRP